MSGSAPSATATRSDVELASAGDEQAFARLVARHYRPMIQVAYVITGDAGLAQDAVQSAWTNAWRKLGSVRDAERIEPWLLRIAANEARQIVRRRRRVVVVEIDPELRAGPRADPGDSIARVDLVRALAGLSSDDRALLALRYVAGLDAAELGAMTGRTASGIRARLSRITTRLRGELGDD